MEVLNLPTSLVIPEGEPKMYFVGTDHLSFLASADIKSRSKDNVQYGLLQVRFSILNPLTLVLLTHGHLNVHISLWLKYSFYTLSRSVIDLPLTPPVNPKNCLVPSNVSQTTYRTSKPQQLLLLHEIQTRYAYSDIDPSLGHQSIFSVYNFSIK